jgi:sugar-specific transcriptional regulator TrmB
VKDMEKRINQETRRLFDKMDESHNNLLVKFEEINKKIHLKNGMLIETENGQSRILQEIKDVKNDLKEEVTNIIKTRKDFKKDILIETENIVNKKFENITCEKNKKIFDKSFAKQIFATVISFITTSSIIWIIYMIIIHSKTP